MRRYSNGTLTFLVVVPLLVMTCAPATHSQSPNPPLQLSEYVADLQKKPSDDALREKAIKFALTLERKPAVPAEVHELVGRAKYAVEHASSKADFVAAAEAFAKASLLAPWVPEYYFNQAISLEKAERFDDAIKNLQWYLMAAPDAKDSKEVRERIGGLKYAREKAISEAAQQERALKEAQVKQQEDERNRLLDLTGKWVETKKPFGDLNCFTYTYYQVLLRPPDRISIEATGVEDSCCKGGGCSINLGARTLYDGSVSGRVISGALSVEQNAIFRCPPMSYQERFTGTIAVEGNRIVLIAKGRQFDWDSCRFTERDRETVLELTRAR